MKQFNFIISKNLNDEFTIGISYSLILNKNLEYTFEEFEEFFKSESSFFKNGIEKIKSCFSEFLNLEDSKIYFYKNKFNDLIFQYQSNNITVTNLNELIVNLNSVKHNLLKEDIFLTVNSLFKK